MDLKQSIDYANQTAAQMPLLYQKDLFMGQQPMQQLQPAIPCQPSPNTFIPVESSIPVQMPPPADTDLNRNAWMSALFDKTMESVATNASVEADSSELDREKRLPGGRRYPYTPEDLQAAILAVKTGNLNTRESAQKYGIPQGTIATSLYRFKIREKQIGEFAKTSSDLPLMKCPVERKYSDDAMDNAVDAVRRGFTLSEASRVYQEMDWAQIHDYSMQGVAQIPILYQVDNLLQNHAPNVVVVQQFFVQQPMLLQPIQPAQLYTFAPIEDSIVAPIAPPTDTVSTLHGTEWLTPPFFPSPFPLTIDAPNTLHDAQPVQCPPAYDVASDSQARLEATGESAAANERVEADSSDIDRASRVSGKRNKARYPYSPEDLQAAIQAVRKGDLKIRESAVKYGIPQGTLSYRLYWTKKQQEKRSMQLQQQHRLQQFEANKKMSSEQASAQPYLPAIVPIEEPPCHNYIPPEEHLFNLYSENLVFGVPHVGANKKFPDPERPWRTYNKEDVRKAVADIIKGRLSIVDASKEYNVPVKMLHNNRVLRKYKEIIKEFSKTSIPQPVSFIKRPRNSVKQYTDDDMNMAVDAVREGILTVNKASRVYNVPFTTLYYQFHKRPQPMETTN